MADCTITNRGWEKVALRGDEDWPLSISIRGYRVQKHEAVEMVITEPGEYRLTGGGDLVKL